MENQSDKEKKSLHIPTNITESQQTTEASSASGINQVTSLQSPEDKIDEEFKNTRFYNQLFTQANIDKKITHNFRSPTTEKMAYNLLHNIKPEDNVYKEDVFPKLNRMYHQLVKCENVIMTLARQVNLPINNLREVMNSDFTILYRKADADFGKNLSLSAAGEEIDQCYNIIKASTKKIAALLSPPVNKEKTIKLMQELYTIIEVSQSTLLTMQLTIKNPYPNSELYSELKNMLLEKRRTINYISLALKTHFEEANKHLLPLCSKVAQGIADEDPNFQKINVTENFVFNPQLVTYEEIKFNLSPTDREELKDLVNAFKLNVIDYENEHLIPEPTTGTNQANEQLNQNLQPYQTRQAIQTSESPKHQTDPQIEWITTETARSILRKATTDKKYKNNDPLSHSS